jgi:hypothetical protein
MPDHEAAEAAAADADSCPVCAIIVSIPDVDEDVGCPRCGLIVHSGPRLGPVTDELRRQLEKRRLAATRGLAALAAVRAAGYPGAVDRTRLMRLARLVSSPPLTEAELGNAHSVAAATRVASRHRSVSARQAALFALSTATGPAEQCPVVLIGRHGLQVRIFAASGLEHAVMARWSWAQLLAGVPPDEDAGLLWLAGGSGLAAPEPGAMTEAVRRWADQAASGWAMVAVLRCDPGWAVPDAFSDALVDLLITRTQRVISSFVLSPDGQTDDWWAPASADASAWGMVIGHPAPWRSAIVVGTAGGNVAVVSVGPVGPDAESRALLDLGRTVTAVAADRDSIVAGSMLGEVSWVPMSGARGQGHELVSLPPHSGRVSAVAASVRTLLTLGSDGSLNRIRMDGGRPNLSSLATVEIGPSGATSLAIAQGFPVAVTGGADGVLRVIDTESARRADIRLGAPITALALEPDGRLAVVGHDDGSVAVVALADGTSRSLFTVPTPPAGPVAVWFAEDAASVVAADATGTLTQWSGPLPRGAGAATLIGRHVGGVAAVRYLNRASVLAAGRQDGVLRAWSIPGPGPGPSPSPSQATHAG